MKYLFIAFIVIGTIAHTALGFYQVHKEHELEREILKVRERLADKALPLLPVELDVFQSDDVATKAIIDTDNDHFDKFLSDFARNKDIQDTNKQANTPMGHQ